MPAPSDSEVRGRSLCKSCHRWDCQQCPLQTWLETEGSSVPPGAAAPCTQPGCLGGKGSHLPKFTPTQNLSR